MIETLKTLCALNGVSGDEDAVRDYLRTQAEPYADAIRTDALGNLIVFKRGRRATGSKVLLCAHMDEVGLIVTRATEDGFLKFDFVGGVDRRVVLGKPVELGVDRVPGIVGMKAIHMLTAEERKKVPKTDSLYLDIGAASREEALSKVPLGTYGAFVGEPEELAQCFLEELDPELLERRKRRRKLGRRIFAGVVAAAMILLLVWVVLLETQPMKVEVTERLIIYEEREGPDET